MSHPTNLQDWLEAIAQQMQTILDEEFYSMTDGIDGLP